MGADGQEPGEPEVRTERGEKTRPVQGRGRKRAAQRGQVHKGNVPGEEHDQPVLPAAPASH